MKFTTMSKVMIYPLIEMAFVTSILIKPILGKSRGGDQLMVKLYSGLFKYAVAIKARGIK